MKGNLCISDLQQLAKCDALRGYVAQPVTHHGKSRVRGEVVLMAWSGVVRVAVRDEGTVHRTPWVDEKITCRAVNAAVGKGKDGRVAHDT